LILLASASLCSFEAESSASFNCFVFDSLSHFFFI
jgi:hypothetical protein